MVPRDTDEALQAAAGLLMNRAFVTSGRRLRRLETT
jgi:hypothetical protein